MNEQLRQVGAAARPVWLLAGLSLVLFGLGLARYFGATLEPGRVLTGLGFALGLQLAGHFLYAYFEHLPGLPAVADAAGRRLVLLAGLGALTGAAVSVYGLQLAGALTPGLALTLASLTFIALAYSLPPLRLKESGYGELALAVAFANLAPLLGYLLVDDEPSRLLGTATFGLTFLYLAWLLVRQFEGYARDLKAERRTLLMRLGWANAMQVHNALLLAGYVWLAASPWLGMPLAIVLPTFAALPLAGLQVYLLGQIANGAPPNWRALHLNGLAIAAAVTYLLAFGFWTR